LLDRPKPTAGCGSNGRRRGRRRRRLTHTLILFLSCRYSEICWCRNISSFKIDTAFLILYADSFLLSCCCSFSIVMLKVVTEILTVKYLPVSEFLFPFYSIFSLSYSVF